MLRATSAGPGRRRFLVPRIRKRFKSTLLYRRRLTSMYLLPVARCTNRLRRRAACCGVACLRIWAGGGGGVGLEEFAKRLAVRKRSVFYKSPLLSPPVLSCAALSDKATTLSTLLRASKISYMLKLLH